MAKQKYIGSCYHCGRRRHWTDAFHTVVCYDLAEDDDVEQFICPVCWEEHGPPNPRLQGAMGLPGDKPR